MRLQRTTTEECFVAVPVTSDVIEPEPDANGEYSLDTEKLFAAAIELGRREGKWSVESQHVALHQVQKAPPTDGENGEDGTPTE